MSDIVRLENEYYVRASSNLADDRTRVLKYGDTFAVFNRFGDIEPVGPSSFGLFHAECRHLSQFTVEVNGRQPMLLSSTIREDNAFLCVDLTNVEAPRQSSMPRGTLHIFRLQFLEKAAWHTQIRLLNYDVNPAGVSILIRFAADFADIFEVRGSRRDRKGERLPEGIRGDRAIFAYRGLDNVLRRTHLEFSPKPVALTKLQARFELTLKPNEERSLHGLVTCENGTEKSARESFSSALSRRTSQTEQASKRDCQILTSSEGFNAWLTRSFADLQMLVEGNPEGPYPYAGVPWFSTVFGRDGIIASLQCLWLVPSFAKGVLQFLAQTQASEELPEQDAEPGKILHEMRRGEMAATKEVPFAQYYGSIDSTPLFVMLADAYLSRTGDLPFIQAIWANVKRALGWMDVYGDRDKDGFIEYKKQSSHGLVQQGWKDSHDSVFHANGQIAEPPIALCEVQGYAYAAKCGGARIARALGEPELASKLEHDARRLQTKFDEAFWSDELGTYVLALDGQKKQCRVHASNAGHALFCKIAGELHAQEAASTLLGPEMFSGWGVRTIGAAEARYNPMAYHNGSVWPHDNSIVAMGLSHYKLQAGAAHILNAQYEASRHIELQRMPELFCGFHRRPDASGPTLYPVACAPQAWAAGSPFLMIQACLGLTVVTPKPEVRLVRPHLPAALAELRINGLGAGNASVDLLFRRRGTHVDTEIIDRKGSIEVRESM